MAELFTSASSEGGVTRCPSCRTAFRVQATQLSQHGGMVRCGKCDHVFNARDHLIVAPTAQPRGSLLDAAPASFTPEPPPRETAIEPAATASAPDTAPASEAAQPALAWPFSPPAMPAGYMRSPASDTEARSQPRTMVMPVDEAPAGEASSPPPGPSHDEPFPPLRHEPFDGLDAAGDRPRDDDGDGDSNSAAPLPLIEAMGTAQASIRADDHVHAGASLDELDFGPRRKPARSGAAWVLAGLLLACALALQVVYQYRGDIAILVPEARPYLADACAMAGCELPLPRLEKLVSIEDSDLQADTTNPTVMVLSAVLRNRAPFTQSYPAIELSLTDDRNETVARRVLGPDEYLARVPGKDPKDGFAATTELPLKVFIDAGAVKATGYRLYLFYP